MSYCTTNVVTSISTNYHNALPCLVVFGMPHFAQHEIGTPLENVRTMSVV